MSQPTNRYPYVHVDSAETDSENVSFLLWELGALGVEERDQTTLNDAHEKSDVTLVASFESVEKANAAIAALGDREARLEFVEGDEWRDAWRDHFHPTEIGHRLLLCPSWELEEPRDGRERLVIDPGGAFGSGIHETTRLVLAEIDKRVVDGDTVFDVGCGSGILSIAALRLGARQAYAIDIEAASVEATIENAEHNGVASKLDVSQRAIESFDGSFPLIVANIQAWVLIEMSSALCERVAPGGVLVLSGVLEHQRDEVSAAFGALSRVAVEQEGEWVALVFSKDKAA